ncbi:MAG: UvrB/UvrC motif-containing protein [Phycisphaerae bacterium]|nr:UvrB/UvrC motif-containing protein [Phycisphaerae bacterium]
MQQLCQRCKQAKATVLITDVPEKKVRHLCEQCAQQEGVIVKQSPQTTSQILQEFIKHKTGLGAADDRTCPNCGITFREFRMKGLLGCPHDYDIFRAQLMPLIERAHQGGTHHVGKVPPTADESTHRLAGVLRLRRELQDAIEAEDYENAARLRDKIQALETSDPSQQ